MRYSIIFAATAAAAESYGYGSHDDAKSSSTIVYPSSKGGKGGYGEPSIAVYPSTSVHGYATMTPGYGKPPVTITSQYQPYPTCASKNGDNCDKWNDEKYVSTVIKDYDNKDVTVTKTNQVITIYKTKSTKTHSATPTPTSYKKDDFMKADCKSAAQYNTTPDYKSACDQSIKYNDFPADCKSSAEYNGYSTDYKSTCDKALQYKEWCKTNSGSSDKSTEWYELYEKSYEASFNDLGPHAMAGYPGSGLRDDLKDHQPVDVKEYKNGKWSSYKKDLQYGTPQDVKTYEKPGVYTNPSKDVYVDTPITKGSEAYATAKAGTPVTYGGSYTTVDAPCTVTGAVGAYKTGVSDGKTITSTVVNYVTVYCPNAGKCEIAKPTTTVYDHDTEFAYPTPKVWGPGVYHYDAETVTITKANQPYTCEYKQTKTFDLPKETPSYPKDGDHPSRPTKTPSNGDNDYSNTKTSKGDDYPSHPTKTPGHNDNGYSKTSKGGDYPSYPTKTPGHGDGDYSNTKTSKGGDYPSRPTSTPAYDGNYSASKTDNYDPSYPTATPSSDEYPTYDDKSDDEYSSGDESEEQKDEQPKEDEQSKEDEPKDEQPKEDEPKDEQPKEDEPKDEQPKDEQPTGNDNSTAPIVTPSGDDKPIEVSTGNDNSTVPAETPAGDDKPADIPTDEAGPNNDPAPSRRSVYGGSIAARALRAL